jgi:hypothetical protein
MDKDLSYHPCQKLTYMTTMMTEGGKAPLKNLPYPFPSFGPQESGEQEQQILLPLSPGLPDQGEGEEHDGEERRAKGVSL